MRRKPAAAAVVLGLAASVSAYGQVADLTRASCAQLLDLSPNDRGQLIVWLHGYYAGAAQRAMIDRGKLEAARAAIEEVCARNRAMALIGSEVRSLLLGEAPLSGSQTPALAPPSERQ